MCPRVPEAGDRVSQNVPAWADPDAVAGTTSVDEYLEDLEAERENARSSGMVLCPGAIDAHLDLSDEDCPYCHATL